MFGIDKTAEDWVKSAKRRSEKLIHKTDNRRKLQVQRIREGNTDPTAEDELRRMRDKTFKAMISDFEKALDKDPCHVDAIFNKGYVHQLFGERDKAMTCYTKVIEINPNHASALFCIASLKKDANELEEALLYYQKAIDSNPEDADAWFEMAEVLSKSGDSDAAKEANDRAVALHPTNLQVRNGSVMYFPRSRLFS
jgi:tetratricopeptide (TPR) repeat protein